MITLLVGIQFSKLFQPEKWPTIRPHTIRNCARSSRNAARRMLGTLRAIISEPRAPSTRNGARDDLGIGMTARLVDNDGDAVIWDGGDDLTMSADMIYALAEQIITPKEFATFLARNNLTQEAAAAHLGRSRRQIATYATTGPIPRIVAWACYGFDAYRRAKAMAEKVEKDEHAKNNKTA
ncbi:hypothetical protein I6F21_26780 [Bradyrhizobium sp. NBAIM03]|uniref:hypothetical protein n=1 Tax=Bradyrhizobium sp. NBAIM03 TaxID=2793816 RepID=UPI001CD1AA7D|nr:hypothetical protein [Bradyrhizobium sp. NBAIM03]MCA1536140.1 hypothetical protein [Bradyrhizobium sp. NBAIM03]